jgi:lactobin A/cerein 7B family class IIb bacteriocin
MKNTAIHLDNVMGVSELSKIDMKEVNGGSWLVVAGVIGAVAAGAYLYEFGYNMVDKAFARAK